MPFNWSNSTSKPVITEPEEEKVQEIKHVKQEKQQIELPIILSDPSIAKNLSTIRIIDEKIPHPLNNHRLVKQKLKNLRSTIDSRNKTEFKNQNLGCGAEARLVIDHSFNHLSLFIYPKQG
jgi:hypothetical protein